MLSVINEGQTLSITGLGLTRKQYYSRLHLMIIYNLVSRAKGKYRLTSFGKVVFDWHLVLAQAVSQDYWKLRALDVLYSSGIPDSERNKITDALVKNEKLGQFIKV
jgi:predicted transcriptional regulator